MSEILGEEQYKIFNDKIDYKDIRIQYAEKTSVLITRTAQGNGIFFDQPEHLLPTVADFADVRNSASRVIPSSRRSAVSVAPAGSGELVALGQRNGAGTFVSQGGRGVPAQTVRCSPYVDKQKGQLQVVAAVDVLPDERKKGFLDFKGDFA